MKQCLRCQKTYTDPTLNFCLDDGEILIAIDGPSRGDDSPPTVMFDQARRTNPTGWPSTPPSAPPAQWQQPQMNPASQYVAYPLTMSPNQTLAIVSLCLGISSLAIGWCCYIGFLLGPAAIITGFIAISQNSKNPERFGGRGMAIGGIVTGALFVVGFALFLAIVFLGSLAG